MNRDEIISFAIAVVVAVVLSLPLWWLLYTWLSD